MPAKWVETREIKNENIERERKGSCQAYVLTQSGLGNFQGRGDWRHGEMVRWGGWGKEDNAGR